MSEIQIALVVLVALVPITHDGQAYAPGERLLVTEAQAKPLVDGGAAELAPDDAGTGGSAAPASNRTASASKRR